MVVGPGASFYGQITAGRSTGITSYNVSFTTLAEAKRGVVGVLGIKINSIIHYLLFFHFLVSLSLFPCLIPLLLFLTLYAYN